MGLAHVGTSIILVLLVPHCQRQPSLGPSGFGLVMASLSLGAFAGFVLTSLVEIPARSRLALFLLSAMAQALALGAVPWLPSLAPVLVLGALSGLAMSVESTVVTTVLHRQPEEQARVLQSPVPQSQWP